MNTATLFENGTVIDGTGAAPRAEALLVDQGRIAALGAEAVARAGEAERIDATGMTLMPGLIDAHCHLAFDDAESNTELFHQRRNALSALIAAYNAKKLIRAGVTGILDPDSTFENMIDLRDAILAGVAEGPRMACGAYALITSIGGTAGRLINDSGITGFYMAVNGADEIVAEVRRQIKYGADWIKVHVTGVVPRQAHKGEMCAWSDAELKLICDTAHDLETPVMGHCRGADATRRAAEAGFDLLLHATMMDEAALEAVVEAKVPLVPTLTLLANLVDFGDKTGTSPSLVDLLARELEASADTLARAHKAGVPMLCGSESGFLHRALRRMALPRDGGLHPLSRHDHAGSNPLRHLGGRPRPSHGGRGGGTGGRPARRPDRRAGRSRRRRRHSRRPRPHRPCDDRRRLPGSVAAAAPQTSVRLAGRQLRPAPRPTDRSWGRGRRGAGGGIDTHGKGREP